MEDELLKYMKKVEDRTFNDYRKAEGLMVDGVTLSDGIEISFSPLFYELSLQVCYKIPTSLFLSLDIVESLSNTSKQYLKSNFPLPKDCKCLRH